MNPPLHNNPGRFKKGHSLNKKEKVTVSCYICKKVLLRHPCNVLRKRFIACSRECAGVALRKEKIPVSCEICRQNFRVYSWRFKRSRRLFCSSICKAISMKKSRNIFSCEICKKEFSVMPYLKQARFCSKKCQGDGMRGANSYCWKNGVTPLRNAIYNLKETNIWSTHIFQRDNYTCQKCKTRGGTLQADHIIPFSIILQTYNIRTQEDALKCDFLWDIRNGRTLCVPCHKLTPTYGYKAVQLLKK